MRPMMQTQFGTNLEDVGNLGNGLPACLASILEIPLEGIPNSASIEWLAETNAWLIERFGLYLLEVRIGEKEAPELCRGYHVITGRSPRATKENDFDHCVVGHNGKTVHDPHPSGDGTTPKPYGYRYGFLVSVDPKQLAEKKGV